MTTAASASEPPAFRTNLGFVLATVGSAVGLGNIWRFPFIAGENGGGAFLLPYVLAVVLIAGPAMLVELAAGRASRRGIVGTLVMAARGTKWVGVLICLASLVLVGYYLVITGWALGYLVFGLGNVHPRFGDFTSGYNSLWFFFAAAGLTVSIVALGVNRGIESSSRILMPLLVLILVALAAYAMTLSSRDEALEFYLFPDFDALLNPQVWIRAFGQAFFSMGVGMGVLVTYGAYTSAGSGLVRSAGIVAGADIGIAVLAGLVMFPLAFSFGSDPGAGPQLAFDTLPRAFEGFGTIPGYVVAVAFYLALVAAAITSAVSLVETAVVGLKDSVGLPRRWAIGIVSVVLVIVGVTAALSYSPLEWQLFGTPVLDALDQVVGDFALPLGAMATMLVIMWGGRRLLRDVLDEQSLSVRVALWLAKWAVPVTVTIVLFSMLFDVVGETEPPASR